MDIIFFIWKSFQNYEFISNQHSFMVTIFCSTFDKVKYKCYLGSETNFRKRPPLLIMGQLSLHLFLLTQTKQISLQFFSLTPITFHATTWGECFILKCSTPRAGRRQVINLHCYENFLCFSQEILIQYQKGKFYKTCFPPFLNLTKKITKHWSVRKSFEFENQICFRQLNFCRVTNVVDLFFSARERFEFRCFRLQLLNVE